MLGGRAIKKKNAEKPLGGGGDNGSGSGGSGGSGGGGRGAKCSQSLY